MPRTKAAPPPARRPRAAGNSEVQEAIKSVGNHAKSERKHAHYFRWIGHLRELDVYRVLDLFGVTDQALGHAIKKLLLPGIRGAKCNRTDIQEAIDALERKLEMMDEDDMGAL